jgi:hypothetical protein
MTKSNPAEDLIRRSLAAGPPTYNAQDAAKILQCRPEHVSRLVTSGELIASQRVAKGKGSPLIITRESLVAYLARGVR